MINFKDINYKEKRVLLILAIFVIGFIALRFLNPAELIGKFTSIKINDTLRFNNQLSKLILVLIVIAVGVFVYIHINSRNLLTTYQKIIDKAYIYSSSIFSIKSLLIICIAYLIVLFYSAITRYDLGINEAAYIIYAKTFSKYLFPFITMNGSMFGGQITLIDNFSMLPFYLLSYVQFHLNLTEIWHFKLLAVLLSSISLVSFFYIFNKWYDLKFSIVFLFLMIIQPGFGFVASSYFGEIVQSAFFFLAIYIWFHEDKDLSTNHIVCVSLLFTLAAHTKMQILPALLISLLIFHFVDKTKMSLKIMGLVILFFPLVFLIRSYPAIIYDRSMPLKIIKFWFLTLSSYTNDIVTKIERTQLTNRFFSLLFTFSILSLSTLIVKKTFEKFILTFTILYTIWYIFLFPFTTYTHLFMAIIPLVFLSSLVFTVLYKEYSSKMEKTSRIIITFLIILIALWGFSTNIIYALVGYNDGVQFDLDGYKSRLFREIKYDDSQKKFYKTLQNYISVNDSIYIGQGGLALPTSQFYLPDNPIFDIEHLKTALDSTSTRKYLIIDRVSFPLGLEPGRKMIDSLKVNKQLLVKDGDFELYSVSKQ